MPICPSCKQEFDRRKNGECPGCGTAVQNYNGRWYREEIGSPTIAILEHFEKRVSMKQRAERDAPVNYRIPRKGDRFRRELVVAERLLDSADDIDVVLKTIDFLFDDRQFNFKSRSSLMGIEKDFGLAMAIVIAVQEAEEAKRKQDTSAIDKILRRENIFS